MQYAKELMLSTTVALLVTGCVKPTEQVTTSTTTTNGTTVYSGETATTTSGTYTPVYEDSSTIVYSDPATTSSGTVYGGTSGTTYGGTTTADSTVITTDGYENSVATGGGAYGNPYGGATTTTNTSSTVYNDPYAVNSTNTGSYTTYDDPYASSSSSTIDYTTNTSYANSSYSGGGIQLQVAALRDYASAEEFKNNLSLDPKYSAYVKRGAMNKVIITGIATRSEAKRLAATRFPGAFIVGGSEMSGGSSYDTSSYLASNSGAIGNGIGVQVGAFSSKSSARAAAESAARGRYTAIVKTANVRGRTIYKAIILGFPSKQAARSAIASGEFGDAFVVTNIH